MQYHSLQFHHWTQNRAPHSGFLSERNCLDLFLLIVESWNLWIGPEVVFQATEKKPFFFFFFFFFFVMCTIFYQYKLYYYISIGI